ncbi:MAG: hypothetical protein L0I24_18350 [Pseudonocardia sp.]|nr:hypothetical protein [Pseudonocardia sp.]
MTRSVRESVGKLELRPEDVGISVLAVRYARTIDDAAELAEQAARMPYDPDTAVQLARLRQRVEAHTVMVEVGPKLQAALDALGATPKARAQVLKPTAPGSPRSALSQLRGGA